MFSLNRQNHYILYTISFCVASPMLQTVQIVPSIVNKTTDKTIHKHPHMILLLKLSTLVCNSCCPFEPPRVKLLTFTRGASRQSVIKSYTNVSFVYISILWWRFSSTNAISKPLVCMLLLSFQSALCRDRCGVISRVDTCNVSSAFFVVEMYVVMENIWWWTARYGPGNVKGPFIPMSYVLNDMHGW